jgi:hypothetical protein
MAPSLGSAQPPIHIITIRRTGRASIPLSRRPAARACFQRRRKQPRPQPQTTAWPPLRGRSSCRRIPSRRLSIAQWAKVVVWLADEVRGRLVGRVQKIEQISEKLESHRAPCDWRVILDGPSRDIKPSWLFRGRVSWSRGETMDEQFEV